MKRQLLRTLLVGLLALAAPSAWADTGTAVVKATYINGSEADESYGEIAAGEAVYCGYNKISGGKVELANSAWGVNNIAYLQVDASAFEGTITGATLGVDCQQISARGLNYGVGYNTSEWSSTLTWNTADRSITTLGNVVSGSKTTADKHIDFDIKGAFKDDADKIVTIIVYQTAAGAGYIKNPTVTIEYTNAATANYTVKYMCGETEIKEAATRLGIVGEAPVLETEDQANVTYDGQKYIYTGNNAAETTIASDGTTVVTVSFREAALYTYYLNSSIDSAPITSGTGFEGDDAYAGYPRYWAVGEKLYEASKTSNEYRKKISLTADALTEVVDYGTVVNEKLSYYIEAEQIEGMTVTTSGNIPVRASNAQAATATEDVLITTLSPGKYKLHVGIFTSKSSYNGLSVKIGVGEKTFEAAFSAVNLNEVASDEYELTADTDIKFLSSTSADTQFDYIWIEKTGDVVTTKAVGLVPGPWAADGATYAAYAFNADDNAWFPFEEAGGSFVAQIPDSYDMIDVVRLKPATDADYKADNGGLNWDNKWNQTADIDLSTINEGDVITITGWGENDYTIGAAESLDGLKQELGQAIMLATQFNEYASNADLTAALAQAQQAYIAADATAESLTAAKEALNAAVTAAAAQLAPKVKEYLAYLENETLNADVTALQTALASGNQDAIIGAIAKAQTDFLAAVPNFVDKTKFALAAYKDNGKTAGADQVEAAIAALEAAAAASDANIATVGAAVANVIEALKAFTAANMTYTIAGTKDLTGTENDWDVVADNNMTLDEVLYTWTAENITVNAENQPQFKVVITNIDGDQTWVPASDSEGDHNWVITPESVGGEGVYTITITYNPETQAISVTGEKQQNTYTATFTTDAGWESVYAYTWTKDEGGNVTAEELGAWPGTAMTPGNGGNDWKIEIKADAAPQFIIFHNNQGGKTEDLAFEDGKAYTYNIPDVSGLLINTEFNPEADPIGWTAVHPAQYYDLGMGLIGQWQIRNENPIFPAPTVDEDHLNTEYAAGLECRWQTNYAAFTQTTTAELPVGAYTLTFDIENVNSNTTKAAYENRFSVTVGENVFADDATEWMNGATSWRPHVIIFTVTEPSTATVSLGYGTGSNNIGANNTPALYVSHLELKYVGTIDELENAKLEAVLEELAQKIDEAKAAKTASRTTGVEEFDAAIAAAEALRSSGNIEEIQNGIEALDNAIKEFKKANWFIDLTAGEYYIIDAETYLKFAAGHNYGTRAIVNEMGLDLTLTPYTESRTVTIDSRVSNGGALHFLGENLYMDSSEWGWALEYQGFGFYIMEPNSGKYINLDEDNNLVLSETPREFIIVTKEGVLAQRLEEMAEGTPESPKSATFLLQNPNFNRNDQRVNAWQVTASNKNLNGGNQLNNCAESYHSKGGFTVQQAVSGAPAGIYRLTIQGFFRQDDSVEEEAPVFFIGGKTGNIQAMGELPDHDGNGQNSMSDASVEFTNGKYTSESIEFLYDGQGDLTVGVTTKGEHQWVIFDNFQLEYCGTFEPVYTVAGGVDTTEGGVEDAVFTLSWDPTFEANDLSDEDGDGVYTLSLEDVQLTPGSTIYYKVASNHDWIYQSWGFDGKNADYVVNLPEGKTLPEGKEKGYFDIVFKFNPTALLDNGFNLTCEVTYDEETTTGISAVVIDAVQNGQAYNLQGQKVVKAKKGLYIINGKKQVVK